MTKAKLPAVEGLSPAVQRGLEVSLQQLPEDLGGFVADALRALRSAAPTDAVMGLVVLLGLQRPNVCLMLGEYMAEGAAAVRRGESTIGTEAMNRLLASWTERGLTRDGGMMLA